MGRYPQRLTCALVASLALAFAPPSQAAWDPNGEPVPTDGPLSSPSFCPDASGGAFTFWTEYALDVPSQHTTLTVLGHRRSSDGLDAPGWPAGGKPLAQFEVEHFATFRHTLSAADGAGGAYVLAFDPSAAQPVRLRRLFHFLPDGSLSPGWPDAGVAMGDSTRASVAQLLPDGVGGAYVGWTDFVEFEITPTAYFLGRFEARATRLLADGTFAPGWTPVGRLIEGVAPDSLRSFFSKSLWLTADPLGGLFAANADSSDGDRNAHVWHYSADAALAPGWPSAGVPLHTTAGLGLTAVTSDGMGGVYAAWTDSTVYPDGGAPRLLRLDGDGQRHAGWPPGGLVPMESDKPFRWTGTAIADGAGGVYLLCAGVDWSNRACVQVVRRDGDGAMHPLWPAKGIVVPDSIQPGIDVNPVTDGSGGLYVVWRSGHDYSGSAPEFVSLRLRGDGTAAPGWSASAPRRVTLPSNATLADVEGDGRGSCYGIVRDDVTFQTWLHQIAPDDEVVTSVPPPAAVSAFALTAHPNPAPGATELRFNLPHEVNTVVAIYSPSGRRIRRWTGVMAAGEHRVAWDGRTDAGARTAPGVYFAMVRAGGLEAVSRIAFLE